MFLSSRSSKGGAITLTIRRSFHAANFLLFAAGVTALSMGAYFHANPPSRRNAIIETQHIVTMIIVGLLTILNSFLGLWASLDPVNRPNAVRLYPAALVIITICMVVMGLKVWVQTLTMHRDFQERWQDGTWGEDIRLAFQMGGKCCGFTTIMDNPVLSETCFLGTGAPPCAPWVWEYGDSYLRNIYTCIFALVIVDVIAFLCGVVLTEVRAEESRYIRIRGKAGSSDGLVEPPSYISATQ